MFKKKSRSVLGTRPKGPKMLRPRPKVHKGQGAKFHEQAGGQRSVPVRNAWQCTVMLTEDVEKEGGLRPAPPVERSMPVRNA